MKTLQIEQISPTDTPVTEQKTFLELASQIIFNVMFLETGGDKN